MSIQTPPVFEALVSVFDILGAKSVFAKKARKDVEASMRIVKEAFNLSTETLLNIFSEEIRKKQYDASQILSAITFRFYGDTIVFLCNLDSTRPSDLNFMCKLFITQSQFIIYQMFEKGLPIRGCLDCGYICEDNNIITGSPYVNSITIADKLEFSGAVVTNDFIQRVGSAAHPYIYEQNVPTKEGFVKQNVLDWLDNTEFLESHSPAMSQHTSLCDVRQALFFSFFRHEKSCNASTMEKLNNTETHIRLMRQHRVDVNDLKKRLRDEPNMEEFTCL